MKAICLLPIIPVRTAPCEQSEQCTQLLFGELYDVDFVDKKWCAIRNEADDYTGFVSAIMVTTLSTVEYKKLKCTSRKVLSAPLLKVRNVASGESLFLTMGSVLYNCTETHFSVMGEIYEFGDALMAYSIDDLAFVACQMRGTPYLWGGKSLLGIDCSGFVQVVFSVCGKQLPRDASLQVNEGKTVCFLSEAKQGDIAFFKNDDGTVVHVGLLLNEQQIIHASGSVKISPIDSYGILDESGEHTHQLCTIKRIENDN